MKKGKIVKMRTPMDKCDILLNMADEQKKILEKERKDLIILFTILLILLLSLFVYSFI